MEKTSEKTVSIDVALGRTKYGKFNYFVITIAGMILLNVIMDTLGIGFVLPIMCDMDMTYKQKGVLGAVGFLGVITSSHLWGFLADTTGRRRVIMYTLISGYIVSVISSLSTTFLWLAFLRYANGFLVSGGSATIYAYLGELHCNKLRNRAIMSAAFVCVFLAIFHPIMGWAVINRYWSFYVPVVDIIYRPWRMYLVCCGSLGLVCGLFFLVLPESPKYLLSVGREEEAIEVLKKIYSINTGMKPESFEITSIVLDVQEEQRLRLVQGDDDSSLMFVLRSMWSQTAPFFKREHRRKTLLACFIQFWIFFSSQGVYLWFPYLLNNVMQFTKEHPEERKQMCEIFNTVEKFNATGNVSEESECVQTLEVSTFLHAFALEVICAIIFIFIAYFTGKLGRRKSLFIILFLCGSCGILSALIDIPIVAVYLFVVLFVVGLNTPVLSSIVVDLFPTHLRAMAVCISLMMGRIGSVAGTNVIGIMIENHCQMALMMASSFLLLAAFVAILLPKGFASQKSQSLEA